MTETPSLLRVHHDDSSAAPAAAVLARAFFEDPMFVFLAPDAEQRRRWLKVVQTAHIEFFSPEGHTYAAVNRDGEIGGAVCLIPPNRYPMRRLAKLRYELRLVLRPSPWCPPLGSLFRGAPYDPASSRMHPWAPHWYVHTLGVDPRQQGKGLGSLLMERAVELADSSGNVLYLETQNEGNLPFYQRHGLQLIGQETPHTQGPTIYGLSRQPSSPSRVSFPTSRQGTIPS